MKNVNPLPSTVYRNSLVSALESQVSCQNFAFDVQPATCGLRRFSAVNSERLTVNAFLWRAL